MTINTNDTRNEYTATASQTVFTYDFKIFASTDLNVYQTPAGQECSDSDIITAYTVTGVGAEAGGTVVLNTGATVGDKITIVSDIPESRTTDYQTNGDFIPSTVNDDFDRVVSLAKQTQTAQSRTPQFPECLQGAAGFRLPVPVAGAALRTKSDLSGYENVQYGVTPTNPDTRIFKIQYTDGGSGVGVSGSSIETVLGITLISGDLVSTDHYDSSKAYGSGGMLQFTGATDVAKAGNCPDTDSYFYDADGKQFAISNVPCNVKQFGAVGDGVNDDTSSIQAAITRKGRVIVPAGDYLISSSLQMKNRSFLDGESAIWAYDTGLVRFKWGGASNGVMIQAATNPVGTPSTSSLSAVGLRNINLDGQSTAGIGLYVNYCTNESIFYNISARNCNLFGMLIAKVWYGYFEKLVARDNDGVGIAIGYNWQSSYDDLSVNGVMFRDIRASNCGVAYNATTAPTGFDLSSNPVGGCGIYYAAESSSGAQNLLAEGNYGPGLVVDAQAYCGEELSSLYIEANMATAVSDGTSTHQFGVLLYNSASAISHVVISNFFGHESSNNYRFYYLDSSGSLSYTIKNAREIEIITTSTGTIPIRLEDVEIYSISSGAFFDQKQTLNTLEISGGDLITTSALSTTKMADAIQFDNGDTVNLVTVELRTAGQNRGSNATIDISVFYYGSTGAGNSTSADSETFRINLVCIQRFSGSCSTASSVTSIDTVTVNSGGNLITTAAPTVTFDTTDPTTILAHIRVAPASTGTNANNQISTSFTVSGAGMLAGRAPAISNILEIV